MPRTARKISETGVYHVVIRGINRQLLFEEADDYEQFLTILAAVKALSGYRLFAYCLMSNHVHLLVKEGTEPLGQVFRRIGSRYASWFNWKYDRSGHLFQDRFLSEPVESDAYFVTVLSYIHQNPVKAGLCKKAKDYKWSSRQQLGVSDMIDDELFDIVELEEIVELDETEVKDLVLDPGRRRRERITDQEALAQLKALSGVDSMAQFSSLESNDQATALKALHSGGVAIRQLSRLTGISKSSIDRMLD